MSSMELNQIQVDENNLYREELITDLKVASIRKLVPIRSDGSPDDQRSVIFSAQTHVMSQMGALPVNCPLEAKTLADAIREFPSAVKKGVERMIEEAREFQRQEAGRIVVPRGGGMAGGGGMGGMPGKGPGSIIT